MLSKLIGIIGKYIDNDEWEKFISEARDEFEREIRKAELHRNISKKRDDDYSAVG